MTEPRRWKIEVDGAARRGLHRLPEKVSAAIVELITGALADDPYRLSKPLRGELADYRSARRGDYRVLIRIDDSEHVVLVVRVGHRADIYRSG